MHPAGQNILHFKSEPNYFPCFLESHNCTRSFQIGDRNFYTLQENDIVLLKPEWKRLQKEQLYKSGKKEEAKKPAKLKSPEEAGAEDNSSEFEDCEEGSEAGSVSSMESSANIEAGGSGQARKKGKQQAGLMTKVLKKKKLKKTRKSSGVNMVAVKPGDRVVTETLSTR